MPAYVMLTVPRSFSSFAPSEALHHAAALALPGASRYQSLMGHTLDRYHSRLLVKTPPRFVTLDFAARTSSFRYTFHADAFCSAFYQQLLLHLCTVLRWSPVLRTRRVHTLLVYACTYVARTLVHPILH